MDIFANIAANSIGGELELLHESVSKKIDAEWYFLESKSKKVNTPKKINTNEELYNKLEQETCIMYERYLALLAFFCFKSVKL